MKNRKLVFILSFLLILVVIPFTTSDPSFSVYTPKRDQIFTIGNNKITWDPPENVNHVRIELHKGFNRIKALDTWVDNTDSFVWIINESDTYEYGKDYRIKVLSAINDEIYGWSDYFTIDLHPFVISIEFISIVIISILLLIVILMYYDKKTHKIQNKIKKIIRKRKKKKEKKKKMEERSYDESKKYRILNCPYCNSLLESEQQICHYCGYNLYKKKKKTKENDKN